jgi:hypothetical protein
MLRTTIVYESMFGATREVAEAIVRGLAESGTAVQVRLRRVGEVTAEELVDADLLVLDAPTHVRSLSRPKTRKRAEQRSFNPEEYLTLEPAPSTRASASSFRPLGYSSGVHRLRHPCRRSGGRRTRLRGRGHRLATTAR